MKKLLLICLLSLSASASDLTYKQVIAAYGITFAEYQANENFYYWTIRDWFLTTFPRIVYPVWPRSGATVG